MTEGEEESEDDDAWGSDGGSEEAADEDDEDEEAEMYEEFCSVAGCIKLEAERVVFAQEGSGEELIWNDVSLVATQMTLSPGADTPRGLMFDGAPCSELKIEVK